MLTGCSAGTTSGGQLDLSRWLQGLPPAWDACAVTAIPSVSRRPAAFVRAARAALNGTALNRGGIVANWADEPPDRVITMSRAARRPTHCGRQASARERVLDGEV